jgi:hypothetical protein
MNMAHRVTLGQHHMNDESRSSRSVAHQATSSRAGYAATPIAR